MIISKSEPTNWKRALKTWWGNSRMGRWKYESMPQCAVELCIWPNVNNLIIFRLVHSRLNRMQLWGTNHTLLKLKVFWNCDSLWKKSVSFFLEFQVMSKHHNLKSRQEALTLFFFHFVSFCKCLNSSFNQKRPLDFNIHCSTHCGKSKINMCFTCGTRVKDLICDQKILTLNESHLLETAD